jgi:hypothetical protein
MEVSSPPESLFIEQIYEQRERVGEEAKDDRLKNHAV